VADEASRIVGLYQRHAAAWDARRGRSMCERPWLDRFLDLLPSSGSVLDLGCGGGDPIARHVVERGFAVTGIDSAPAMIGLSSARLPGTWIVADMRRLTLTESFDGILAWDSFFHLTPKDQRAMFPIFAAHAAPGGALMFTSGTSLGQVMGEFEGEPLYHASLAPNEYRARLEEHNFSVIAHAAEDPQCGGHTIWLARKAR